VFPIEKMCKVLEVSRSGYYAWLKSSPAKRAIEDKELMERIKLIHKQSHALTGAAGFSWN